jgi:hypothetical protein
MILLSPDLVTLLRRCVNYAYFFRVIPYKWSETGIGVFYVQTKSLYRWGILVYLFIAHQLFLIWRFGSSFHDVEAFAEHRLALLIAEALYVIAFTYTTIFQILQLHLRDTIQITVNRHLLYLMQMQGKSNTNHRIELATLLFYRLNMDMDALTVTFAIKSKVCQANALSIQRTRGRFWLYDLKGPIMLGGKV